jgi:hypothetical protein
VTPTPPVPTKTAQPPSGFNPNGSSGPVPPRQPAPPPQKSTLGKIYDWMFGGKH